VLGFGQILGAAPVEAKVETMVVLDRLVQQVPSLEVVRVTPQEQRVALEHLPDIMGLVEP
jgi:hypothetical protein